MVHHGAIWDAKFSRTPTLKECSSLEHEYFVIKRLFLNDSRFLLSNTLVFIVVFSINIFLLFFFKLGNVCTTSLKVQHSTVHISHEQNLVSTGFPIHPVSQLGFSGKN